MFGDRDAWPLTSALLRVHAGEIDDPVGIYTSATQQLAHLFGIHAIVGRGATLTGDDQLFGMDRAWFAMIAQQTSAGVL